MRILHQSTVLALAAAFLAGSALSVPAAPKVIASIVPLHALVAGVMDGVGEPELLLKGQTSEHQASYSPQQIKSLGEADVVFIIGHGLELKLDEISGSEAVKGKKFVELADLAGLTKLAIRQGGAFEAHDHDHEHEHEHEEGQAGEGETDQDHDHADKKDHDAGHDGEAGHEGEEDHDHDHDHGKAAFDPHLWLDPENAKLMVAAIASDLAKADPENAARYDANAKTVIADLSVLSSEISAELAPVKDKPFVVFHDAYQYFENRFGVAAAGSISDFSGNEASAQRLKEVHDKVKSVKAVCVFREPQFSDKAAKVVIEGTTARDGVLDPIGSALAPGKGAYRELLMSLARNLKSCLAG